MEKERKSERQEEKTEAMMVKVTCVNTEANKNETRTTIEVKKNDLKSVSVFFGQLVENLDADDHITLMEDDAYDAASFLLEAMRHKVEKQKSGRIIGIIVPQHKHHRTTTATVTATTTATTATATKQPQQQQLPTVHWNRSRAILATKWAIDDYVTAYGLKAKEEVERILGSPPPLLISSRPRGHRDDILRFWEIIEMMFQYVALNVGPFKTMHEFLKVLVKRHDLMEERMNSVLSKEDLFYLVLLLKNKP